MILLALSLLVLEHLNKDQRYQREIRVVFALIMIALVFFGGLRYRVGFDYVPYAQFFRRVPGFSMDLITFVGRSRFEIGFVALASFFKTLGITYVSAVFVSVIVICLTLNINSLKKYTSAVYFSLFMYLSLYFFGREMGQIRQAMATAIVFFAFRYVLKKQFIPFLLLILLAGSFHYSVLIVLPFYFLSTLKLKQSHYIILIVLGVAITFIDWLIPLNNLLLSLNFRSLPYIGSRYGGSVSIFSIQYARRLFPAILAIITMKKLDERFEYFRIALNMVVFGAFFSLLFNEAAVYVERMFVPFIFFEVLIFGFVTQYSQDRRFQITIKSVLVLYAFVFLLHLFITKSDIFFPYQNQLYFWLYR
jgi:hypothetical protein